MQFAVSAASSAVSATENQLLEGDLAAEFPTDHLAKTFQVAQLTYTSSHHPLMERRCWNSGLSTQDISRPLRVSQKAFQVFVEVHDPISLRRLPPWSIGRELPFAGSLRSDNKDYVNCYKCNLFAIKWKVPYS
jgi:hypothetical protein